MGILLRSFILCLLSWSSLGWRVEAVTEHTPHRNNVHHGGTEGSSLSCSWSHRSICRGGASETITTKEEEEYLDAYVNRLLEESETNGMPMTTTTSTTTMTDRREEEEHDAPQQDDGTVVDTVGEIHDGTAAHPPQEIMKTEEEIRMDQDDDSSELPENRIIHEPPSQKKEAELEMAQDHGDMLAAANHQQVGKSTTANKKGPTQLDDDTSTLDSNSSSKATNTIASSKTIRKNKRKKQAKPKRPKKSSSSPSTGVEVPAEKVENQNANLESQTKEVDDGIQLSPDTTGKRTKNGFADAADAADADASIADAERKQVVRKMTPPNALYRMLLRRGPLGHGVVSVAVVCVEWVELYLPWVAHFISWILKSLHIYTGPRPIATSRHNRNRPSSSSSRAAHMNAAYAGVVSRPGKVGQLETKKADEVALAKLRTLQLGTTNNNNNSHDTQSRDAKYRHVSTFFLKRHGLGPYNDDRTTTKADAPSSSDRFLGESFRETTTPVRSQPNGQGGTSTTMASFLEQTPEEQQDLYIEEQDWVVQALQEGPYEVSSSWTENNVLHSPSSVRVGLDIRGMVTKKRLSATKQTSKRTKALSMASVDRWNVLEAAAAAAASKSCENDEDHDSLGRQQRNHDKRPAAVQKTSDRDSGVMGRLRAAGANSLVSRQLLGAYPGDAVPPQQAGSANGVMELALKYGYGDWSDDNDNDKSSSDGEEEDDFWNPPKQTNRIAKSTSNRVKRTRRRKRSSPHSRSKQKKRPDTSSTSTTSSFSMGVETEWSWGGEDGMRIKRGERNTRIKRRRFKSVDAQRTRPAQRDMSKAKQEDSRFSVSLPFEREGIARMKQTAAKGPGVVRSPMQRLNEAQGSAAVTKMKQTLAKGHRSMVQPPMQRLGEAQRKARQESKDNQES